MSTISAHSPVKYTHYLSQLSTVLLTPDWHRSPSPFHNPAGGALPFEEGLRKLKKHAPPERQEAVQREAELLEWDRSLRNVLGGSEEDRGRNDAEQGIGSALRAAADVALVPAASRSLDEVVRNELRRIHDEVAKIDASLWPVVHHHSLLIRCHALALVHEQDQALQLLGQAADLEPQLHSEVEGGDRLILLRKVERAVIEGETLERSAPLRALSAYSHAVSHLPAPPTSKVAPQPATTLSYLSALALSRSALLSFSVSPSPLPAFRLYLAHSRIWPAAVRSGPRHINTLLGYLKALLRDEEALDAAEVRRVREELGDVLRRDTGFPRAGEVNKPVLKWVDLVVKLWKKGGEKLEEIPDLLEILYTATALTFHSQLILRHLLFLTSLHPSTFDTAARTLRLYHALTSKARETNTSEINKRLKARTSLGSAEQALQAAEEEEELEADCDNDRTYVRALVGGARVLVRCGGEDEAKEAVEILEDAGKVAREGELKGDELVEALVERMLGIAKSAVAAHEADPVNRPKLFGSALSHLQHAASLDPSSSETFYALARTHAETRDIEPARGAARKALELDPQNVDAWHLLALLLSTDDLCGAREAAEAGLMFGAEEDDAEDQSVVAYSGKIPPPELEDAAEDGVIQRDMAFQPNGLPAKQRDGTAPSSVADPISRADTPVFTSAPQPSGPRRRTAQLDFPPTRLDAAESLLRLRMTLNVIVEALDGPEGATESHQELFTFFASRIAKSVSAATGPDGDDQIRASLESAPIPPQPVPPKVVTSVASASTAPVPAPLVQTSTFTSAATSRSASPSSARAPASTTSRGKHFPLHLSVHGTLSKARSLQHNIRPGHRHRSGASSVAFADDTRAPEPGEANKRSVSIASSIHSRQSRLGNGSVNGGSWRRARSHSDPPAMQEEDLPPPPADSERDPREARLLAELWLSSAATFRRWGKMEQARGAIQEAEALDPGNPDVWVQLGLYHAGQSSPELAQTSFNKALSFAPDHPAALVNLARSFLDSGAPDLAEGLLEAATRGAAAWSSSEAWYFLGKAYEVRGRAKRARECFIYALELEDSKIIRPLDGAVPRA